MIAVIQLLETDIDVVPTVIKEAAISWIGCPVNAFEIYSNDAKLYLGIDDGKLRFMEYDNEKCEWCS